MKYILIGDLAGTCSDYGIAMYLRSMQRTLSIIHFVVPAILIVMAAINLTQLMINPDDPQKKKFNALKNKFVAAVIIFFIPMSFNIFFSFMPDSFDIANCWEDARIIAEQLDNASTTESTSTTSSVSTSSVYTSVKESEKKAEQAAKEKEKLRKKVTKPIDSDNTTTTTTTSSGKGEDVVKEARKYLGNPYAYGGCSLTKGTDCSCFVKQIYAKFGVELPRTASAQSQQGKRVAKLADAQPGDLLFYVDGSGGIGHVAMYQGNNKVIHASSPSTGIKESNVNYRKYAVIKRFL